MAKRRAKKAENEASGKVNFDILSQVNLNAAGIDVGSAKIHVSVPEDRDSRGVREFGSFTTDLYDLASWLSECRIDTVAMEATGVYWVTLFDILEELGFEVFLVNARHTKNVGGRKTDVLDCQWIRQLHSYGLLAPSFHPSDDIRALRALVRHRDMLVKYRASHIQHMQKALDLMNLKLHVVLTDISGLVGMNIIRAIVAGEYRPEVLATFRIGRCKYSEQEIAQALHGHYRQEHLFALTQALELYDSYSEKILCCDQELEQYYLKLADIYKPEKPGDNPQPQQSYYEKKATCFNLSQRLFNLLGVDLTAVDGLSALSVQTILTEVGLDMSKFKSAKHFASWMGLAPNNKVSGGKILRSRTPKVKNRAANAFRMAAQSVNRSKSALGAFYRRIKAKHGSPIAITATANKIARVFYTILKSKIPYSGETSVSYDESYKKLQLKQLHKQAAKLGFSLQPAAPS